MSFLPVAASVSLSMLRFTVAVGGVLSMQVIGNEKLFVSPIAAFVSEYERVPFSVKVYS